jgi:hypothetical protein
MKPSQVAELKDLAHALRITKSQALRQALHAAAAMILHSRPTCASGQACMVPQMHTQPNPDVADVPK